ncbi:MAG: MraY family glycosyltransferase [Planctomycetota bacterium]
MIGLCLAMVAAGFVLCWPGCWLATRMGGRMGLLDAAGGEAHKEFKPPVPNVGGVAVFWAIALPMAAVMAAVWFLPPQFWEVPDSGVGGLWSEVRVAIGVHLEGLRASTAIGGTVLGALAIMHVLGLFDDRRPLGPWSKLAVQVGVATAIATSGGSRVLDFDVPNPLPSDEWWKAYLPLFSVLVTVLWIVAITNAFNFLDNMDGLSAGIAAVIAGVFLAATVQNEQWFVASLCAVLLGALLGFLWFNLPPARLYLGDGGSLVVGLLLAVISVRMTYVNPRHEGFGGSGGWHAVLTPLVIFAVPLYDLISVSIIRLREGRSPMSGDRNHFSHRLVKLGLSRPAAVFVIVLATLATGLGGVMMSKMPAWQAALIAAQAAAVLATLAVLERAALRGGRRRQ